MVSRPDKPVEGLSRLLRKVFKMPFTGSPWIITTRIEGQVDVTPVIYTQIEAGTTANEP